MPICLTFILIFGEPRLSTPLNIKRPDDILEKWKLAGHSSRRAEAANTVYIMSDAPNEFKSAPNAWKGNLNRKIGSLLTTFWK